MHLLRIMLNCIPEADGAIIGVYMYFDIAILEMTTPHESQEIIVNMCQEQGVVIQPPDILQSFEYRLVVDLLRVETTHVTIADVTETSNVKLDGRCVDMARYVKLHFLKEQSNIYLIAKHVAYRCTCIGFVKYDNGIVETIQEAVIERCQRAVQEIQSVRFRQVINRSFRLIPRPSEQNVSETDTFFITR